MIQRIQTAYLFFGAVLMAVFFAFPTVWYHWIAPINGLLPWGLLLWGGVTSLLGLGSIFLYGNRERQRRVVVIVQWTTIVFAAALYSLLVAVNRWNAILGGEMPVIYVIAILFPVAAYVLFYLARRGIDHDIEKVRSVDRLR